MYDVCENEPARADDEAILELLQMRDPGVELVREFHEAFGCYIADEPWMVPLNPEEQAVMAGWACRLEQIAAELKVAAAVWNQNGSPALGLALVRVQLHVEESGAEFARAIAEQNMVKVLDSLTDSSYVVDGSYLTFGLGDLKVAADAEVHASNMTKLGEDGQPIINEAGRVVKGPNYQKANLQGLLEIAAET